MEMARCTLFLVFFRLCLFLRVECCKYRSSDQFHQPVQAQSPWCLFLPRAIGSVTRISPQKDHVLLPLSRSMVSIPAQLLTAVFTSRWTIGRRNFSSDAVEHTGCDANAPPLSKGLATLVDRCVAAAPTSARSGFICFGEGSRPEVKNHWCHTFLQHVVFMTLRGKSVMREFFVIQSVLMDSGFYLLQPICTPTIHVLTCFDWSTVSALLFNEKTNFIGRKNTTQYR